jgi:hypothetical protein
MAVVLFRETESGVETCKVEPQYLQGELDAGWSLTDPLAADDAPAEDDAPVDLEALDLADLRALAAEAGIEGEGKHKKTLIKELQAL